MQWEYNMYIIIQHDYWGRFELIDAMVDEDGTAVQTFKTEEDARNFMHRHGMDPFEDSFPHQIRVCRLH